MTNRLTKEKSLYLQQHAHNPVDWYPWSEEALSRARSEDKPILLSIGYSACHWCHVMAHESFENPAIAGMMNNNFVNIKVDREERPDLDSVYMEAVQAMTGRGGWPMTVFLTPEGKPFFAGTYFPPEDRQGMPGFIRVLKAVADIYRQRRDEMEQTGEQLAEALSQKPAAEGALTSDILTQAYLSLRRDFDGKNGGFGGAPKFPQPVALEYLLRYYHRTGERAALEVVQTTLDKMACGGIYDHLGGGFHRYSTDAHWLIPHFEKMLYDNALLSQVYLQAYLVTGKTGFRTVVEQTLDYVIREMTAPEGGFYSTQDADSEGLEGKFYTWTPAQIIEVAGEENGRIFCKYFGVTEEGNLEGRSVLNITEDIPQPEKSIIEQVRVALMESREKRIKPGRDEKKVASWNGLMLASMSEASCVFQNQEYLSAARNNGSFIIRSLKNGGKLEHNVNGVGGFLDDYAMVIEGLLALHQATFEGVWLKEAVNLAGMMVELFWDEPSGVFYDTSPGHEKLFIRPRSTYDGAVPSGSSAAVMILLKMARLTGKTGYTQIAERSLRAMRDFMGQYPLGSSNWLCALDFHQSQPREIAIIGAREHPDTIELMKALCNIWSPNKVFAACDPDDKSAMKELPLFQGRQMVNGQPTVYVCRDYVCQSPVNTPQALISLLR